MIEIEGKKARVQRCLSKQHKLWYNIGSLRRPDRLINEAVELKDIKVKGQRKIAEVVMGGFNSASQSPIITTKTRQLLEGYMAHNCGIADVLPSDHPYRKGPPRR